MLLGLPMLGPWGRNQAMLTLSPTCSPACQACPRGKERPCFCATLAFEIWKVALHHCSSCWADFVPCCRAGDRSAAILDARLARLTTGKGQSCRHECSLKSFEGPRESMEESWLSKVRRGGVICLAFPGVSRNHLQLESLVAEKSGPWGSRGWR